MGIKTQAQFMKLFDFNKYASQTISEEDYMDFLLYFLKPKIREIVFRQFEQPHDVQKEGFNWSRFDMEVTATLPLCRHQPEWLWAVQRYVERYLSDHGSQKLKTFQSQTIGWPRGKATLSPPKSASTLSPSLNMDSLSNLQQQQIFGTSTRAGVHHDPEIIVSQTNQDNPCSSHVGETPTLPVCATGEMDDVTQFLIKAHTPLPSLQPAFGLLGVRTNRHLMCIAGWKDEDIRDALELCARKNLIQPTHIEILFNAFRQTYVTPSI